MLVVSFVVKMMIAADALGSCDAAARALGHAPLAAVDYDRVETQRLIAGRIPVSIEPHEA